jgi:asparagine synthase (glutamine-hydrolysing)
VPGLDLFYAKNAENNLLNKEYKYFTPFLWQISHLGADAKMQHDYYSQKLRQMLMWDDRNGMVNSIESRNPFADDMLLARWLNVPFKQKLEGGYTKSQLRTALQGLVPETVRLRSDKRGFTVPDADLTRLHLKQLEPYFMSSVLDDFSPRLKRDKLLKNISLQNDRQLRAYFRFSAFSAWLTHIQSA